MMMECAEGHPHLVQASNPLISGMFTSRRMEDRMLAEWQFQWLLGRFRLDYS